MIPHNRPTLGEEEQRAAATVIASGWLAQGTEVAAFENELCAFLGLPQGHAVALSSGSAALFLALWLLDAKARKVALPVYACAALRNAVALAGGEELLLDIAAVGPNLDPAALSAVEADVAIVPHIFGLPIRLGNSAGLRVIEDCAQALGATVSGRAVGLQGDIGIFSFYATKLITSGGQGGMLVARDKALVDTVRDYREFDCRRDNRHRFNFQMTDLQAAIGRVQLQRLPGFLERRAQIFSRYRAAGLPLLDASSAVTPAHYRAVMLTQRPQVLLKRLETRGIKAIVPIEDWELLGDAANFPNAYRLTQRTVSLPLYPSLSNAAVEDIIAIAGAL